MEGKISIPVFLPKLHVEKHPEKRRALMLAIAADATKAAGHLLRIAEAATAYAREIDQRIVEERFARGRD